MKKLTALLLSMMMLLTLLPVLGQAEAVKLTMGSWRADDVEQMNNLLALYKEKTGVEIIFQPTIANEYNATLRLQLDNGTGPDLMYARSYATGGELFEAGYFADVTDMVIGIYSQNSIVTDNWSFAFVAFDTICLNNTCEMFRRTVCSFTMVWTAGISCPGCLKKFWITSSLLSFVIPSASSSRINSTLIFASSYPVACFGFAVLPSTSCSSISAAVVTSSDLNKPGRRTPSTITSLPSV